MWPFGKSTEKRLQEAIKENKVLKLYKLETKVNKKTAVVTGEVPRDSIKNLIKVVAEGINGIDKTDVSGVNVAKKDNAPEPTETEDSSAKAKAALANIKGESSLANNPLDVLQSGDTIVLRGAVDSQAEFDKAKSLADKVEGVASVDTSGLQIIQHASQLNVTDDDGDVVYTVKSGDTLSHIALNYYGDAGKDSYMKIATANGLDDPNKIQAGQNLKIPGTTDGPDAQIS